MPVLLAALLLGTTNPPPADDDDDRPRRARSVVVSPPTAAPATSIAPRSPARDDDDDHGKAAPTSATKTAPDADDGDGDGAAQEQQSAIVVTAHRLDVARANVEPDLGASTYTLTNDAVENRPGGETTNLGRILLQVPGVSQLASGAIAVRGSRAGLQYRVNNVIIPQGVCSSRSRGGLPCDRPWASPGRPSPRHHKSVRSPLCLARRHRPWWRSARVGASPRRLCRDRTIILTS